MDDSLPDLTSNETAEEVLPDLHKLTETCIMLKKRISKSHELIKQYNDKVKECERLKQDLDAAKKQVQKITCTHNSTLAKVIKLEIQNTEYKKNIETLNVQAQDHIIKAAADQQHIQQLICKIKDIEGKQNDKILQYDLEKCSLQVKVKELEQELKSVRKSHDTKMKKIEKKHPVENESKPELKDAEMNTEPIKDTVIKKRTLVDKCISTKQSYNVKSNVYPIYCEKCEIPLEPPPLEKICKMMSNSCPKLIEKIISPAKRPLQISTDLNNDEFKAENVQPSTASPSPNMQNQNNADLIVPNLVSSQRVPMNRADYNFSPRPNTMNQINPYYSGSTPINLSMANTSNTNMNNHAESITTIASSLSIIPWFQEKVDTLEAKVSVLEKKLNKKSHQNNACNCHSNSYRGHDMNHSIQSNLLELWKKMSDFSKNKGIENFDMHRRRLKSRVKKKRLPSMRSNSWNVESIAKRTKPSSNSIVRSKKSKHRNKSNSPLNINEDLGKLDSASDVDPCSYLFNYDTLESENAQREQRSSGSNIENTNTLEYGKSVGGETDSGILSDSMQPESDMDLAEPRNTTETASSMQRLNCTRNMSKQGKKPLIKVASNLKEPDKSIEKNAIEISVNESEPTAHTEYDNRMEEIESGNLVCTRITRKRKMMNESREAKKSDNREKLLEKLNSLRRTSKIEPCPKTSQSRNVNENSCTNHEQQELHAENNNEDDYVPKKKPRIAHVPKTKPRVAQMSKSIIEEKSPQLNKRLVKNVENDTPNTPDNCDLNILDGAENRADQDTVNCNTETVEKDIVPSVSDTANLFNDIENKNLIDDTKDLNESVDELMKINIKDEHEITSLEISEVQERQQKFDDKHSSNTPEISDVREISINHEVFNDITIEKEDSSTNCETKIDTLLMRLQQHITQNPNSNKTKNKQKVLERTRLTDKFMKKQLQRLASSDWQTSVHWEVVEKLTSTSSARIIAKGIIDFLSMEVEHSEPLDKSHTPPAPLMTKTQQKIVTLLIDLEEQKPEVFQLVQAGIEYKLLRLNQTLTKSVIESLSRMYTVLARVKKDRERVRMFCCDALYCLGLNVVSVLYVVLISWPEVFPNCQTNSKPLPKCIAHLIMSIQAVNFPKLNPLKNLLSVYYNYPMGSVSTEILSELLTLFQKKCDTEVETAIILLAKREGTVWTYQNIIKGALLPMIINEKLPSSYRAFGLLGNLMRAFPIEDKDNLIGEIVAQLCDLINSGEGSDEQKEGVFSALLSLSRHKFDTVIDNAVKWVPSAPLQDRTIEQINGMFNLRTVEYWRNYLKKNKLLPTVQKKSRT